MSDRSKEREPESPTTDEKVPAAGPHATPELTNPDATPGAGSLPDEKPGGEADGGTS